MTEVGQRLKAAIDRNLSIAALSRALGDNVPGSSRPSIHAYIAHDADREPSLSFLNAAADALGVRKQWLILGEGSMTPVEEVTQAPGEALTQERKDVEQGRNSIWEGLREEWPDLFNPLPSAVQAEVLQVLSRYVLTCSDGGEVPRDEEDLERVVELGGYLLWQLWAPMRAWNFPDHPTGEIRSYHGMKLMLSTLEHFLPDRRSGEPIAAFRDSDEFAEWQRQMQ